MKFVGWIPTVTGRLSFSAIGTYAGNGDATTCNFSSQSVGCIFSAGHRASIDGPIPARLLRSTRVEKSHFVTFLNVRDAELPFPDTNPFELRLDEKGALEGTVIAIILGKEQPGFLELINEYRGIAAKARDPNRTDAEELKRAANAALEDIWKRLTNTFANNPRIAPAFARAHIKLYRTGQTEITVTPDDLFLTHKSKVAQSQGKLTEDAEFFRNDASLTARQIFHFIRDIAHKHYHHVPHSDLASTPYYAPDNDDATWRRETHYGLVRMAISSRREDDGLAHKQALGILAYAEAFQNQLAGWHLVEGKPQKRPDFFPYAFKPVRDSIEARIKIFDATAVMKRGALTFTVATTLSALAVIVASSNLLKVRVTTCEALLSCSPSQLFWTAITSATAHPVPTLLLAFLFAIGLIVLLERIYIRRLALLRDFLARFLDAVMGDVAAFGKTLAWTAGLILSAAGVALLGALSYGGFQLAKWLFSLAGM